MINAGIRRGHPGLVCGVIFRAGVCAENLDSTILVMETAEKWRRCDHPLMLSASSERSIQAQRSMCPCSVVVGGKFGEDSAQMAIPEHDHVVETLASDRTDQSVYVPILPWRAGSDRLVADAHGPQPPRDRGTVDSVLVTD